jgi:hypothetical protein
MYLGENAFKNCTPIFAFGAFDVKYRKGQTTALLVAGMDCY